MRTRERQIRRLERELTDTLRVIAYADTTEAYIRERQDEFRAKYGALIPENGYASQGNIQDAYLRFMDVLNNRPEDIGRTCEDILHDCLTRYI